MRLTKERSKAKILIILFSLILIFSFGILNKSLITTILAKTESKDVVLIDPGHGGIDGGAVSKNGTVEKDINLSISLKLRDKLKERDYNVLMTREDDRGLSTEEGNIYKYKLKDLNERCRIKHDSKSVIFISIHQNYFYQSNCFGPQVWYSNNEDSMWLAYILQENFNRDFGNNNRKEKNAMNAYKVLRCYPYIPSVIIECGFLTNPVEEKKLKDDAYQNKLADSIVRSINEYFE